MKMDVILQAVAVFKWAPPEQILSNPKLRSAINVPINCPVKPPIRRETVIMNKVFKIILSAYCITSME